jgi:hypothetical protein
MAGTLEYLHTVTPDRHGTIRDACEKMGGGVLGALAAYAAVRLQNRSPHDIAKRLREMAAELQADDAAPRTQGECLRRIWLDRRNRRQGLKSCSNAPYSSAQILSRNFGTHRRGRPGACEVCDVGSKRRRQPAIIGGRRRINRRLGRGAGSELHDAGTMPLIRLIFYFLIWAQTEPRYNRMAETVCLLAPPQPRVIRHERKSLPS